MRRLLASVAVLGSVLCAGTALSSMMDDPTEVKIMTVDYSDYQVKCGIYCGESNSAFCFVRYCDSTEECCGHAHCFTGGCVGDCECCKSGQTCNDGLGVYPYAYPKCY